MDLISSFRTFIRVAETESFSAVAREFRIGQPAISKQISALEEHLGARLLQRSTRSLALTDEGVEFLSQARAAVEAADEAVERMRGRDGHVSGVLRMTTSASFARMHIVPRLHLLGRRHPELRVDLVLQDSVIDMVEQGLDLAIRFGEPREPNLIARRLGTMRMIVVASKQYLERWGRPATPDELRNHSCLVFSGISDADQWPFIEDNQTRYVGVNWRVRINNSDALRQAVLSGLGIAMMPSWQFPDLWENETLETLFDEYETTSLPMYAVYPSRRHTPAKVRAMIEFLQHEISIDPTMTGGVGLV
ncbi:LysR family transcriptional regulator [Oricola sp.]|uniref:LysR family transcriptional regulator n=1 Tax=Oricola sp. TaxID=1979950 RepID=UPI000C97E439|nr:LysR family transcriptional regulator [Ahrensia sp.]|tara:strand:- start:32269 stop:33186 length:918 start_codon:yes stop_codon:yes gene_type:complete